MPEEFARERDMAVEKSSIREKRRGERNGWLATWQPSVGPLK